MVRGSHDLTVYCTIEELSTSLRDVLMGLSSSLYVWESESDSYKLRGLASDASGNLVVLGSDDVVSSR